MYSLVGIKPKQFRNIPKQKYFASLKILSLFVKSFLKPLVDIALTFFENLYNSHLFDITSFNLLLKSVFFTKLAISIFLAKFACLSLAAKFSAVNLSSSGVVIYLS